MTKNIINRIAIFAILIISFFGMNLEEGKGQNSCPTGFSSFSWVENIGGCWYEIEVCYQCSPTSQTPNQIYLNAVHKLDLSCPSTISMDDVLMYLRNKLTSPSFINQVCLGIGPCEGYGTEVIVFIPICWTKTKLGNGIYYTFCFWDPSYCTELWKICYDNLTNEVRRIRVSGPTTTGNPNCSTEPVDPDNGWSDCFYFPNNLCGYED